MAGASAYYKPGQFSSLLPHVARPEGRIHFAAEHTSVCLRQRNFTFLDQQHHRSKR
jgi:hypothetical protein